jgi:hypothetical protein
MAKLLSFSWFKHSFRESLFRNTGIPNRNLIGLALGSTASILLLLSRTLYIRGVALSFVAALLLTALLLVLVRPNHEGKVDRFAWGLLVIIVLGFGLGAVTFQYRHWAKWLWHQYLRINEPHELLLEALFLLGVILGFFVVRNWAKEQKDFVSSLSAVLGGAFVATILGKLQGEGINEIGALKAFAYYALGFTLSGTINLAAAARLTANYINKKSVSSRALLDFLYGSERTALIDGYFLKNFKEDPDYAKRWLTDALIEYRKLIKFEFAEKMQQRKKQREEQRCTFVDTNFVEIWEWLRSRAQESPPASKPSWWIKLLGENSSPPTEPNPLTKDELEQFFEALEKRYKQLWPKRVELDLRQCTENYQMEWAILKSLRNRLMPSYYYELIAVECEETKEGGEETTGADEEKDLQYGIIYRRILSSAHGAKDDPANKAAIHKDMFRVGIAMRWQDKLEYIIAPGQYGAAFPMFGSVAGLALSMGQTIVMDRDINKKFRSKDHGRGVCPSDIEQQRGLDEITYLSYFSIPVVARVGSPTENALGISNVDTKLFVTRYPLAGDEVTGSEGVFRSPHTREELSEFASNLYEEEDVDVKYVEDHTKIITSVLELYAKCRVGAI